MQHDEIEPEIERLARSLVDAGGADPDTLVQPGRPVIFGTPHGQAVKVNPDALLPLWRFYIGAARMALGIAQEQARKTEYAKPVSALDAPEWTGGVTNGAAPAGIGGIDQAMGI